MKRFKFKLEAPLKVKQTIEKIKKQQLYEAISLKQREEKRLAQLVDVRSDVAHGIQISKQSSIDIRTLLFSDLYVRHIETLIEEQKEVVDKANCVYDDKRQSFLESKRSRQILERVRDNRYKSYLKDFYNEEQNISDELSTSNFARRERKF